MPSNSFRGRIDEILYLPKIDRVTYMNWFRIETTYFWIYKTMFKKSLWFFHNKSKNSSCPNWMIFFFWNIAVILGRLGFFSLLLTWWHSSAVDEKKNEGCAICNSSILSLQEMFSCSWKLVLWTKLLFYDRTRICSSFTTAVDIYLFYRNWINRWAILTHFCVLQ